MKKIVSIFISSLLLLSASACVFTPNDETQETGVHVINDFETNAEYNLLRLFGVLGSVEKNTDSNYVKTGKSSAKVTVEANPYKDGAPYIQQAFKLEKAGKDFTDFSSVSALSLDVYNASGAESRIGLQLAYQHGNGTRKNFTLNEGWNTIQFIVKREYIPLYTNTDEVTAPFVEGLRIMFDRAETDSVYYLDNLQLYKTSKPYTQVAMSLKEDEICSFDSEWQVELIEPSAKMELLPSYMQVSDITSTGVGSAIRIEAPASVTDTESWPGIELNKEMLKLVPWSDYPRDARLCFDVYAPRENGMDRIWMSMYSESQRYYVTDEIHTIAGEWFTFSVSVAEMNAWLNSDDYNFATTTSVVIRWAEHAGVPHVVYLDNFRMEYSD